jgi:DNA-binding protein H-NS
MAKRSTNYEKMDFSDLVQLRDELTRVVSRRIATERRVLETRIAALSELERGGGDSVGNRWRKRTALNGSEATAGKQHPLKGRSAVPKYRGPNGETWAGRGLAPRWLTALEKNGKKRDRFLISR